jgi:hypothetical protein
MYTSILLSTAWQKEYEMKRSKNYSGAGNIIHFWFPKLIVP